MSVMSARVRYGLKYWRLAVHLVFKTQYFGVNNQWWAPQPSVIGWSCRERLWGILTVMPIVRNYQSMKVRSCIGWLPQAECEQLGFGSKH